MRTTASKQDKSLFNGRVGFYNLKLKRKGCYTPPCPILKYAPFCYTECVGALFKEIGLVNATQIRFYTEGYWIVSRQIQKEILKSAGTTKTK